MRGICACIIVLFHLTTQGIIYNSRFISNGFLFVDFFFVLSGFVIAASYGARLAQGYSPLAFMLLRIGRVYPLHIVMLATFVTFEIGFSLLSPHAADRLPFTGGYSFPLLAANVFLVQIFVPPDMTSWNGPSWSIAAELWTYLVFAGIFRFAGRWLIPICLAIATISCVYLGFLTDRYLEVFHDGALARCLFGFSLGVSAFSIHRLVKDWLNDITVPGLWTIGEIASVGLVCLGVYSAGASPLSLLIPPLFFLVIVVFAQERGQVSRLLIRAPFLFVGTLSYSIYMIHLFLELRFVNFLSALGHITHRQIVISIDGRNQIGISPAFGDAMSLLMVAIVIACASLTYRWIEKPMQKWSRARVAAMFHRPVAAPEATAPTF